MALSWMITNRKLGNRSYYELLYSAISHYFASVMAKYNFYILPQVADVYTEIPPWRYSSKKKEQGAQIDLLFDRKDNCINLCEIKFSLSEFIIDKNYAAVLKQKEVVFRERTKTRKTLFLTLITTYGAKKTTTTLILYKER